MHDFYFFCKNCARKFFRICSATPSKIKWSVPTMKQRQDKCYLSHRVSAFAFSIISYRHAARNVFVQFYGNSFAETVCKAFGSLIRIGRNLLDFVAKTFTKNLHFVARMPMNYCKRILQAWIVSCLSIPVLDARKLILVSIFLWKKRKIDISHWSCDLFWFLRA